MAVYEYRCRACGETFEVSRPMSASAEAVSCPSGHDDVARLFSAVAVGGRAPAPTPAPMPATGGGGGCCGGGCCGG